MKCTLSLFAALVAAGVVSSASAAITTSVSFNSTTGVGGITAWPAAPTVSMTGANPGADYNVAENNYGGASLFSIGQSFVAPVSGNLTRAQIMITGTAPVSFNVALYDAGTTIDFTDVGGQSYTPGTDVSNNLLADTSVQTWQQFTAQGANAAVLDFSFSGADQVSLVAGGQYIFEISSTTNPSGMIWYRNGATGNNVDGQAFRQRSPLNGNNQRDMALAISIVPEPATMGMLSLGAIGLGLARRRK